jgi:hypothetical protein
MMFRDVYKESLDLIKPDEAVVESILLKMRKEAAPEAKIKRFNSYWIPVAAGAAIVTAFTILVPLIFRDTPPIPDAPIPNYAITESDGDWAAVADSLEDSYLPPAMDFYGEAEEAAFPMSEEDISRATNASTEGAGGAPALWESEADSIDGGYFDDAADNDVLPYHGTDIANDSAVTEPIIEDFPSDEIILPPQGFCLATSALSGHKFDFDVLMSIIDTSESLSDIFDGIYEIYSGPLLHVEVPFDSSVLRIDDTGELVVLISSRREAVFLYNTVDITLEVLFE